MGWFGVVRGHPRSLKIVPFDRAHATSYSSLIETIRLSCTVIEISSSIGPKSLYFDTPLAFNAPDGGVTLGLSP